MTDVPVDVTFTPDQPGSTKGLLMVSQCDAIMHLDRMDIAKAKERTAFLNKLKKRCPSIDIESVEQSLLAEVRRAVETDAPLPSEPTTELDISRIVRPHLFHVPEVSGLLIPVAQSRGGDSIEGKWLLYLHWAGGTRECVELTDYIDVDGGERIWFSPRPPAPLPGTMSRWSRRGRSRWLGGHSPKPDEVFKRLLDQFFYFLEFPLEDMMGTVGTLSLWTMLTYAYPAWAAVPYLSIGGPLGSGKSRVFEVLGQLVYNPLQSSNLTAPCLFRTLHTEGATVLLDEAERLQDRTPDAGEMRSVLLAGYKRGGQANRIERIGDSFKPVSFNVYGPKAIAGISNLPTALASRCIRIMMFRAGKNSPVPKRRLDPTASQWRDLRDDLHAIALVNGAAFVGLAGWQPDCADLNGRALELWQPILAMAKFVEDAGVEGLVETVQGHALKSIESANDEIVPEADEILLRCLKQLLEDRPWGVTAGEVLEAAKEEEPPLFGRYSARGVGAVLNRYGIRSHRTGGKRHFKATEEQWRSIEGAYGIDLGMAESDEAAVGND